MRVDLGPLRWRESDAALYEALLGRRGRPTAWVLSLFHAAKVYVMQKGVDVLMLL